MSRGDVRCFVIVVQGDKDGSSVMKSCFVVIVVNDVVSQCCGAIRTECWKNRSCLVDGIGDVLCFAIVVQGNEDGSGVIKSCFVVIVVSDMCGDRVVGRCRTDCWRNCSSLWDCRGTLPSSWRATGVAAVS